MYAILGLGFRAKGVLLHPSSTWGLSTNGLFFGTLNIRGRTRMGTQKGIGLSGLITYLEVESVEVRVV